MMQRWEYKIVSTNPKHRADKAFENKLNELGKKKWELIGVQEGALYFKRPFLLEFPNLDTMIEAVPPFEPIRIDAIGKSLNESS